MVAPRDEWDGAVRTFTVTPLSNFQVSIMSGRCHDAIFCEIVQVSLTEIVQQFFPIEFPIEVINEGKLLFELFQETFREASHDV